MHRLHGEEPVLALLSEVVQLHDIGVYELGAQLRFVDEHGDERGVVREALTDSLDDQHLLEARVPERLREEHLSHSPHSNAIEQVVPAERAGGEGSVRQTEVCRGVTRGFGLGFQWVLSTASAGAPGAQKHGIIRTMKRSSQAEPAAVAFASLLGGVLLLGGCGPREFTVAVDFVVPAGHASFEGLDFLSVSAEYGDEREYTLFLEAPSSGDVWDVPNMPAGTDVELFFEGLVSDELGGDGQIVAASGSAGPLDFDPEVGSSARVLFTRRGRTGTLPGGLPGSFEPRLTELPGGGVLATGGADGFTDRNPVADDRASLFGVDGGPDAFSFVPVAAMRGPRMEHATLLIEGSGTELDGRVLVVGTLGLVEGRTVNVVDLDQDLLEEARDIGIPEVFDPETGTWEDLADDDFMRRNAARSHHALGQVGDGVFVIGGVIADDDLGFRVTADVQRIDLEGGDTVGVEAMSETRWRHSVTPVGGDRLLVVGGAALPTNQTILSEKAAVELYDAGDDAWTDLGDLEPARSDHVAVGLPDGLVMVASGLTGTGTEVLADTWLIDPSEGTWQRGPDLGTARAFADARLLSDGRVVVCGGETVSAEPVLGCEVWSAGGANGLGAWAPAPDPGGAWTARTGARVALLDSDEVLVVGGQASADDLVTDLVVYRP